MYISAGAVRAMRTDLAAVHNTSCGLSSNPTPLSSVLLFQGCCLGAWDAAQLAGSRLACMKAVDSCPSITRTRIGILLLVFVSVAIVKHSDKKQL